MTQTTTYAADVSRSQAVIDFMDSADPYYPTATNTTGNYNTQSQTMSSSFMAPSEYYASSGRYPPVAQPSDEDCRIPQPQEQRRELPQQQQDVPLADAVPYEFYESYRLNADERRRSTNQSSYAGSSAMVPYEGTAAVEGTKADASVPNHINPDGSINKTLLPPKVQRFKQKRKIRTAAATGAGVVVGAVTLGPVGMVLGGVGGYAIAKKVGKHREKKLLEKCLNEQTGSAGANWKSIDSAVSA